VSVSFDADDVETLAPPYPAGWDGLAPSRAAQRFGDLWAAERRSLVLVVPSAIVPGEHNYALNPSHPRSGSLAIGALVDYDLDPRLLS
jgi:RES domain-containing protein